MAVMQHCIMFEAFAGILLAICIKKPASMFRALALNTTSISRVIMVFSVHQYNNSTSMCNECSISMLIKCVLKYMQSQTKSPPNLLVKCIPILESESGTFRTKILRRENNSKSIIIIIIITQKTVYGMD